MIKLMLKNRRIKILLFEFRLLAIKRRVMPYLASNQFLHNSDRVRIMPIEADGVPTRTSATIATPSIAITGQLQTA